MIYLFQINSIEPLYADVYLGNLAENRLVGEIQSPSIRINNLVVPTLVETLPASPGFSGQVLKVQIPIREFLGSYGLVWGTVDTSYEISGTFDDGMSFQSIGAVSIVGHRRGDLNGDEAVNVLDLTLLIDHLFRGARLPEPEEAADLDSSGAVNILDLTRMVDLIFRGGTLN